MSAKAYGGWIAGAAGAAALAVIAVSCGSTGGGGGGQGRPSEQFVLNSNNSGRLTLNVSPIEVDANKSDRLGLVATLTDRFGNPIRGIEILFSSDIPDIRFLPALAVGDDLAVNIGRAVTDTNGNADIIAVAGSTPTGTGAIVGTGAIFATAPPGFGLRAQVQVTLLDVGFIDSDVLAVIPSEIELVEPSIGDVIFFNIVGGTPPYLLKNEVSGIGFATLSQHCAPGCTENGGGIVGLCVGSPCQSDEDCNLNASPTPAGVCIGPIKRCLASCAGTNCGGSRCSTDADCNDGSPTPANVCKDSGQSIAFTITSDQIAGATSFIVEDSAGAAVTVSITVSFVCGNGIARGGEQCDLGDVNDGICASFGLPSGCSLADANDAVCGSQGIGDGTVSCSAECVLACTMNQPTPTPMP
jgi:hypothetical protein